MHHLIETDRLTLKILDESNAELVLDYYLKNKAFLHPWEQTRHDLFYSVEAQELSLKLDYEAILKGDLIRYWIFEKASNELIGSVALTNIIRGIFKSCYLGYKLSEKHIGRGYMVEACRAVIDLAFGEMKLHRIEANIMPNNIPSIKVVTKLGFESEGFSPKYLKINGVWEGHKRFALINNQLDE
ncbi:MAG TPA: 30S ribosomal protein S5 alanine N-acetyltransferase [Clostridiales bacterium UBA8960]|jgi:ribosomal-protein-alanine N-acetyltransferase|nr:30S ribosomal protein S5 alanine N-acetyltransferase [Clostridiales bacterium UBA8960]